MLKVTKKGDNITIQLPKLFGFSTRTAFRDATTGHPFGTKFILDCQQVELMESAALGMLLLLRETYGGKSADITFINMQSNVRKLLQLANFHTLFKVL